MQRNLLIAMCLILTISASVHGRGFGGFHGGGGFEVAVAADLVAGGLADSRVAVVSIEEHLAGSAADTAVFTAMVSEEAAMAVLV
jgi:hypothetical protein